MTSPRMEQVFYNAHSKASHYIIRHTSHRTRTFIEHFVLGCAICAFCTVILCHRSFVHREDVVVSSFDDVSGSGGGVLFDSCNSVDNSVPPPTATTGGGGGMSIYSILIQLFRISYNYIHHHDKSSSTPSSTSATSATSWPSYEKQIPLSCLNSIPGFRNDADVNHILYSVYVEEGGVIEGGGGTLGSRAFTIYRGVDDERLVTGLFTLFDNDHNNEGGHAAAASSTSKKNFATTCVIGNDSSLEDDNNTPHRQNAVEQEQQLTFTQRFGWSNYGSIGQQQQQKGDHRPCPQEIIALLSRYGYLPVDEVKSQQQQQQQQQQQRRPIVSNENTTLSTTTTYTPIVYSYSHSSGLLSLTPNLQHIHNISTQFIIPSTSDANCFGEPFLKSILFKLVGVDTVILNWILGLQHHYHVVASTVPGGATLRPRFVYHRKGKKLIDLDIFDKDHYAFASRSSVGREEEEEGENDDTTTASSSPSPSKKKKSSINSFIYKVQSHPLYRLLRFLTFRLSVLLSSLFIFFLTTSLVSFTLQETQDRMLEFTVQLKDRVRNRMPLAGLIVRHVLENLVFVPIMVGMIFFLIEFYGGDKFLAFSVLSMVWLCEVFSAISIRSVQGMHFFPRVFFLYFTLFHVYFFSCPVGFTYASLASTILFLFHTILFFWNRYELPALHAGVITPQSPRARIIGPRIERERRWNYNNSVDGTSTTEPSTFLPPLYHPTNQLQQLGNPLRSAVNAASNSLQSIRSLASIQSLQSLAERAVSPNLIFHGGYNLNDDSLHTNEEEDDSYMARVVGHSASSEYTSFHHHN